MKSLSEIVELSLQFLQARNVDKPKRTAEELIADALGLKRLDLFLQFDRPMQEAELLVIRDRLIRCAKGEPLAYLKGEVEFYGCRINVDRRVLIPRPETEILVDLIAKQVEKGILWDVCTGSGCIAIALKKARPLIEVSGGDCSAEALSLARQNGERNQVDVSFFQGDLLAPFVGLEADVVVCNPPYVSEGEYQALETGVRDFEPRGALVGGPTGLEFYQRLANGLPKHLKPRGKVFFEIGSQQGEAVIKIFESKIWSKKEVLKDWSGKDRFFFLEKQ